MFFFRYYLDRQAIYYIRSHYEGANDYEKLLAYGKENNIEFDYTTGANYHNRFEKSDGFKRPYNMKVQVPQGNSAKGKDLNNARMVEFIVNLDTGEFDSQWDAYDKHKLANGRYDSDPDHYSKDELKEIANTESFNYGPSKGENTDVSGIYVGKHGMLDVDGTPEPATRTEAKNYFIQKMIWVKRINVLDILVNLLILLEEEDMRILKHGKKIQKICQKKKRLKNTTGLNLHILRIIINLVAIPVILIVLTSCNKNTDAFHILEKQRFILVKDQYDINKNAKDGSGFDLKEKEYYYSNQSVVKNGKVYGGYSSDRDPKKYYQFALDDQVSSVLLSDKITKNDIEKSNYQIVRSPDFFVRKSFFDEEYPPEFESRFLKKDSKFSKVRITYNKEFLPTKIEWYYKGKEGLKWYTWRTYSYPFKNKSYFDKKLDEEIKDIKEIQEENEGD